MQFPSFPFRRMAALGVLAALLLLSASCATEDLPEKRFSENLSRFPSTDEPLKIAPLPNVAPPAVQHGTTATIIVHPAYALFFRDEYKNRFSEAVYSLLKYQLDSEARFMKRTAGSGNVMVLVLPGNYEQESVAPGAYTYYLNTTIGSSPTVFRIFSETSSSGTLSAETLVRLYSFLQGSGVKEILVGGGFIGRCQREFYNQLVPYLDQKDVFIVPEISSISPDDVTDRESSAILSSIRTRDFGPVRRFIDRKTQGGARVRDLPAFLSY